MPDSLKAVLLLFTALLSPAADVVELRDGRRLQGTLVRENSEGLEIEVGRNEAGTIRQILAIDASEIRSWSVGSREGDREAGAELQQVMSGADEVEELIEKAVAAVRARNLDQAISLYRQAAGAARSDLDSDPTPERAERLSLHAHALRMQRTAMNSKVEDLSSREESLQNRLEERKREWQRDSDRLERDRREFESRREREGVTLRTRQEQSELNAREEELEQRRLEIRRDERTLERHVDEVEQELRQLRAEMDLLQERIRRAENEARTAEREARRRR